MRRWLILLLLCLLPFVAQAEVAVPELTARVTDLTGTLSDEQRASLEQRLQQFEQQKGSQIAVLLVPTTQPEDIAQYSIRVVDKWKLGRAKVDDGVLLLVAKDDRKLRIEVGKGLEGALPDVIAKRIVSDDIAPHFKQGDFYGGIVAGVTRIIAVAEGEALPEPTPQKNGVSSMEEYFPHLVIGALVVSIVLRMVLGNLPGALASGGLTGLAVFLLGGGLAAAAIVAVVVFVIGLIGILNLLSAMGSSRGGYSGGSGGYSGGGFSGGGFSGGGGGFGGGGASGDW